MGTGSKIMNIRAYDNADKAACLAIFDSNCPKYFAPHERDEFSEFLDTPTCTYYVLEQDSAILGCGGYWTDGERAVMCWGMVDNAWHGTGLGKWLLLYRWHIICQAAPTALLEINTSQHTFGFFEKLGLEVVKITPNGYGENIDRYDMRLQLNAEVCQRITKHYQLVHSQMMTKD
jgi:ribosomal protein S18 acetylase RimI-like enzyme